MTRAPAENDDEGKRSDIEIQYGFFKTNAGDEQVDSSGGMEAPISRLARKDDIRGEGDESKASAMGKR